MQKSNVLFHRVWRFTVTCLLFSIHSFSQTGPSPYLVTKRIISAEDGFVSREVYCSVQDKDGFMWFGTLNGLNRYDGKNFLLYTKQQGLRKNKVVQIAIDDANRLYMQYAGIQSARIAGNLVDVMDLSTHTIKKIGEVFPEMPFQEKDILWISNNGTEGLVFLTASPYRTWTYTSKEGFRKRCEVNYKIEGRDSSIIFLYYMGQGSLYQGERIMLNLSPEDYYSISPDTTFQIRSVLPLLTTTGKYDALFLDKGTVRNLKSEPLVYDSALNKKWREVRGVTGKEATVFFSPTEGMMLWDGKRTIRLSEKEEVPGFMTVHSCSMDAQGNYWICTSHGVMVVTVRENRFRQYFTKTDFNINHNNSTRGIYADEGGNIFANVDQYVCKMNKLGKIQSSGPIRLTYAILHFKNHLLVSERTLFLYDESKNKLNDILPNNPLMDSVRSHEMWSLFPLDKNKFLAGYSDDILICDIDARKYYNVKYASPDILKPNLIYSFFKAENNIWAVSTTGLYVLNKEGIVTEHYSIAADSSHRLPYDDIQDAYYEGHNIFWLATNGEGLFRWNRSDNSFKQFTVTEGLTSNVLYRIEADGYNNLWISTDNGLVRLNAKTYSTKRYTIKDGISDNEFNRISSFKAKDGRLFFGGLNGINAFYPKDFIEDSIAFNAPLKLVSYNLFSGSEDKIVNSTEQLLASNEITLNPGDRFFTLEFQLLDFAPSELHRYAYKIEGIDNDWNYISDNSIRISGLNYGKYVLHIKGQNLHNAWSTSELAIPLIVLKPFYLQAWFIALAIIISLLLGYGFYRWRTYTLRKEKKFLEQTVGTRTQELREALSGKEMLLKEIHHRVKNNLQVISALLEMQGSRTDDQKIKSAITDSQNRVLSIAFLHQNLYQQDDIKTVEVQTFVNELTQHISHVFTKPGCEVKVENTIDHIFLDIDTAVPLGLIINELLTNSYKYAFAERSTGIIKIGLQKRGEGAYEFLYSDNGVGLPADFNIQKSNSLGMKLVRNLCKQLSGKLEYANHEGSRFTFMVLDLETRNKTA